MYRGLRVKVTLTFDGVSKRQVGTDSRGLAPHKTRRLGGKDRERRRHNLARIVLDPEPFAATKALMTETFGLAPAMEAEGMVLFTMPNGTMLELNEPQAASADYEAAGCELRGEITRVDEVAYAYRRFRGPDGRVYSLNEQKEREHE